MTMIRNRHFLLSDIILLPIATYLSYVLRLEAITPTSKWWPGFVGMALAITITTVVVFRYAGVYSRFWRYASVDEMILLTGAFTVSTMIASLIMFSVGFFAGILWIPRSIPFILLLTGLAATAGPRLSVRIWTRRVRRRQTPVGDTELIIIMGAGDTGVALLREILNNPQYGLTPVAFLDDDPLKHNAVIQGIPVLGDRTLIPTLKSAYDVNRVVIAMPSASGKDIRGVLKICEEAGVKAQTVPGTPELLDGRVRLGQIRDVRIDDLLRREPIQTDLDAVRQMLSGQRVLITGGGGSIGGELARQVMSCGPERIVLLGHGENSIFGIYHELLDLQKSSQSQHMTELRPVIADIRSCNQMRAIMDQHQPTVIFHAAAHKHVPLMECNASEAVLNNVGGTRNLLQAAEYHGVERFVMISTDKAVNPTSVMGATKRVAEKMVHDAAKRNGKNYVTVRFGNVLGSRGSIVPLFQKQIATGGPVTVTHPDVERFFMTIPEAVQLVLQASILGRGGELFMLDMGEPVRILDLAKDLIRLSGYEVGRDIDIEITGLRPGDKLYEEMFLSTERYARTQHTQIYVAANGFHEEEEQIDERIQQLLKSAEDNDVSLVYRNLHGLVLSYKQFSANGSSVENGAAKGTNINSFDYYG